MTVEGLVLAASALIAVLRLVKVVVLKYLEVRGSSVARIRHGPVEIEIRGVMKAKELIEVIRAGGPENFVGAQQQVLPAISQEAEAQKRAKMLGTKKEPAEVDS